MWPSIPSFRPFGDTPCPAGSKCEIPYCIFSHVATVKPTAQPIRVLDSPPFEEHPSKRVKLGDETKKPVMPSNDSATRKSAVGSPTPGGILPTKQALNQPNVAIKTPTPASTEKLGLPKSVTRPISPPPKSAAPKPVTKAASKPDPPLTLYPRKLAKEPATFVKRWQLLKMMREAMGGLNEKVLKSAGPDLKALTLTSNQLNKLAMDEEEKIGLENRAVYDNIIKKRLVALKKMSLDGWVDERRAAINVEKKETEENSTPPEAKPVQTGLSENQEILVLHQMITPQDGLDNHGYVTRQHTESELDETRAALHMANSWEQCDRCHTRFQVFPDRREEDGALTTGGPCRHHWGRKAYPKRIKGHVEGPTTYGCCGRPIGSDPCSTAESHVFKVDDSKRLSTIMPFIETPPNDKVELNTAVCFDCEMGYTTMGMELLRITAISWPAHKSLLDILVRPLGQILDLNTRFSGVKPDQFFNAKPYDPEHPTTDPKDLRIVDSPYIARDLFLSHIAPDTPVAGHALENDLNNIRVIHPNIVDTVLLYPHPRGLPIRHGLRALADRYLNLKIQQAGAAGHDSFEDARATGELVRFKIAERWRKLKSEGWTFRDDGVYPPVPSGLPPPPPPPPIEHQAGEKRKIDEVEGGERVGEEGPPFAQYAV